MADKLPGYAQACQSLCQHGEQFPANNRRITAMSGVNYEHPDEKGMRTAEVDDYALTGVDWVHVGTPTLRSAFVRRGVRVSTLTDVLDIIVDMDKNKQLIVGFSGYGGPGREYGIEARMMKSFFDHLKYFRHLPAMICDGATSDGIPGLSGVLAAHFRVPSLGYIPLEGLGCIGPRTRLVAHKVTFGQRLKLVGVTANLLVALPGGKGTIEECLHTLEAGGTVLHLMSRKCQYPGDSLPVVCQKNSKFREAEEAGKFIVCDSRKVFAARVGAALDTVRLVDKDTRSQRLETLAQHLK